VLTEPTLELHPRLLENPTGCRIVAMTVRVHAMEREHTKPVIDDPTHRLRRVPLSPEPDRAPVTERRPPMLLARFDGDPPIISPVSRNTIAKSRPGRAVAIHVAAPSSGYG